MPATPPNDNPPPPEPEGGLKPEPAASPWRNLATWLIIALGLFIVGNGLARGVRGLDVAAPSEGFNVSRFAQLPVMSDGRIKPMDTLARNSLSAISNRGYVRDESTASARMDAVSWLMEVALNPPAAAERKVFRIDDPAIAGMLQESGEAGQRKRFSFNEVNSHMNRVMTLLAHAEMGLQDMARDDIDPGRMTSLLNDMPADERERFIKAARNLREKVALYQNLSAMLAPPWLMESPLQEYKLFLELQRQEAPEGLHSGPPLLPEEPAAEETELDQFSEEQKTMMRQMFASRYAEIARGVVVYAFPPSGETAQSADGHTPAEAMAWHNPGELLLRASDGQALDPLLVEYAALAEAWRTKQPVLFNDLLSRINAEVERRMASASKAGDTDRAGADSAADDTTVRADGAGSIAALHAPIRFETFFNNFAPVKLCLALYVLMFIAAAASWLGNPRAFSSATFWVGVLAFLLHTFALLARMYIQQRPPVTNLYSSAVFVGWGAILPGLVMERLSRNGMGAAVAALCGFCTLLIASHLGSSGDTLDMMRAVLNSNFWLTTHVVTITLGYSANFLAGLLALFFIVRALLTQSVNPADGAATERMVYGTLCFALFFSFIGTVLGGIWAEQSWGRFWGWDPKENGALMIVMWNALILHARAGKLCARRGLMQLAIGGNIITSWSWFGVNMLGVGLHSYGFMDSAFLWMLLFWGSQLLVIGLAGIPARHWRSSQALKA